MPKKDYGETAAQLRQRFHDYFNEFVALCAKAGIPTCIMADVVDEQLPSLRRPFQNEEDNG